MVNKFIYGPRIPFTDIRMFTMAYPKRGEVIVFKYPENESKNFIKRVVGLPGDKIEIKKGKLFINDEAVTIADLGSYVEHEKGVGAPYYDKPKLFEEQLGTVKHQILYLRDQSEYDFGPKLVPADSVFVMGDNRDNSQDSRFWGFVKYNKILGRAFIIYWSWDGAERWIRWERIGTLIR
jgi:signal peptidase I